VDKVHYFVLDVGIFLSMLKNHPSHVRNVPFLSKLKTCGFQLMGGMLVAELAHLRGGAGGGF